jgi:hypothetical protein
MAGKTIVAIWVLTFCVQAALIISCGGRTNLVKAGVFAVEEASPAGIKFAETNVYRENGGLLVTGKLLRTYRSKSYPGHVDIALVAPGGKVVGTASVKNKMPFIGRSKRKTSSFRAKFTTVPPEGSTIHVRFHRKGSSETGQFDCGSNIAKPGS